MADNLENDVVVEKPTENGNKEEKNKHDITKCTCQSVVVYQDRAEVCRSLKTSLLKGENEVTLTNLSNFMDTDSVRVEGKGPATISEVSFQTRHITPEEAPERDDEASDLRKQLEELNLQQGVLQNKANRLRKQRNVLDSFADGFTKPAVPVGKPNLDGGIKNPLNPETIQGMQALFDLYDSQANKLDDSIFEVEKDIRKLSEKRMAVEKNLHEMRARYCKKEARELSILLDANEDCEVILNVSYVVTHANWTPKYDIRVFSNEKQMKIMYYGMIQQSTGEDWENTKLSLSTAMPSIGGTVPELGTQKLSFKHKTVYYGRKATSFSRRAKMALPPMAPQMISAPAPFVEEFCTEIAELQPDMDVVTTEVKDSMTSAVFEIARESTIPADNVSHKVSVAIIDFSPIFEYECVPKKSTYAFLKAKVKNTSQYALLAGPTNIFLDNNFIAKAELKSVSPGEEFDCSLGIDSAVKVTYKPLHKFREESGYWNKSENTTYKQVIELKNNHQDTVKILLMDQLPLSTDDRIKVVLLEPAIKKENQDKKQGSKMPIRLNKNNNVEWDLHVNAGASKELLLKYVIEHPVNEELDMFEVQVSGH